MVAAGLTPCFLGSETAVASFSAQLALFSRTQSGMLTGPFLLLLG